ncbi:hypothetical protein KC207_00830 [Phycicoccus sp. BSK3Z-2]|uniref:SGNH hydrolase-type esterase domain-containing protein n=1 Tax=Phycicoccus avicenniae TaxID=2828860 RepID=A0A941D8G5_9MICO|nr:GDSL-type esterase/lipase family protein [Phycicoccus avicenniae]MBR7741837.1 hypothetical protein [Phycicoccus avicenniae]
MRAEFCTDARSLRLLVDRVGDASGYVDVVVDGHLARRVRLGRGPGVVECRLPGVLADVQLWLPQVGITRVGRLVLTGAKVLTSSPARGRRWVAYGSSITQCCEADGPSETWPSLLAAQAGWDLVSLGFSGECFLDEVVALTIRRLEPHIVTICAGINVYNAGTWSAATLAARLRRFLDVARGSSHTSRIHVVSPVISPSRESVRNQSGLTLVEVRDTICDVVTAMPDARVTYVDGRDVLGHDDAHLLLDGLHPTAEGYALMARRLIAVLDRASC